MAQEHERQHPSRHNDSPAWVDHHSDPTNNMDDTWRETCGFDVIVSNLCTTVSASELREIFALYGEIICLKVGAGTRTPHHAWGLIRFRTRKDAENAVSQASGRHLHHRAMIVKPARSWVPGPSSCNKHEDARDKQHNNGSAAASFDHTGHSQTPETPISKHTVYFSHCDSPVEFWAHPEDCRKEMTELDEQLQQSGPVGRAVCGKPSKGKLYVTIYSADSKWYRCKVLQSVSDTQSKVFFVDYGNSETKENSEINEILSSLSVIKPQAKHYCLSRVRAVHLPDSREYNEGCAKLFGLLDIGPISVNVYNIQESGTIAVDVHTKALLTVNEEMVRSGFAEACPYVKNQQLTVPRRQAENAHKQRCNGKNIARDHTATGPGTSASGLGKQGYINNEIEAVRSELQKLQLQLQQANAQVELKNQLIDEGKKSYVDMIKTMKIHMEKLEEDNRMLRQQNAERTLPNRLSKLVQSVNKVKDYRNQFPSQGDPIEKTFEVLMENNVFRLKDLKENELVEEGLHNYQSVQNAIRAAEGLENLEDLVVTRNACRVNLHELLFRFIDRVKTLPLAERASQLKETLKLIKETYKDDVYKEGVVDIKFTTLEEAKERYEEWKVAKPGGFQDARTWTNTWHNAVNTALLTLQQQLSLDSPATSDNCSTVNGIDLLFDGFNEALEKESNPVFSLDMEADGFLVPAVLKMLERELSVELSDIHTMFRLLGEFESVQEELSPWLVEKPDLTPVVTVRQQIRTVKSKLRHKLADFQDLMDSDNEVSNLNEVKEELKSVKEELQMLFLQEDEHMFNFSELNENHYPELHLQNPELGLETYKENKGLLKQGRDLDHYDLEEMPGCSKNTVFKTTFYGTDAVLKEYIIDDRLGVKRPDFLRRAFHYNNICNPHILPLTAIFFTGGGRHVYLELPYYKQNLTALVEAEPPSPALSQEIVYGVLIGLQAVHANNLVVGALHPNNILLTDDTQPVISEVDFSKSPNHRVGSYVSSSGLKFQPPEAEKNEISWASDMYNLGLLALWLHFPTHKFSVLSNGVPDITSIEMDGELTNLLVNLLQEEPASRRTANSVRQLPYFSNLKVSPDTPDKQSSPETLKLRPKSENVKRPGQLGGILKNKDMKSPTSSPVHRPAKPDAVEPTKERVSPDVHVGPVPSSCEPLNLIEADERDGTMDCLVEDGGCSPLLVPHSPTSTPSPIATPRNTPVDGESGSLSPPHDHQSGDAMGLVKDAMTIASLLVAPSQLDHSAKESLPEAGEGQ